MARKNWKRALRDHYAGQPHDPGCGCTGEVRLHAVLFCSSCSATTRVDAWMPSSGLVGQTREVGTGCWRCGAEVEGQALIVDRRDFGHTHAG